MAGRRGRRATRLRPGRRASPKRVRRGGGCIERGEQVAQQMPGGSELAAVVGGRVRRLEELLVREPGEPGHRMVHHSYREAVGEQLLMTRAEEGLGRGTRRDVYQELGAVVLRDAQDIASRDL